MLPSYLSVAFIVAAVRDGSMPVDSCAPVCPSPSATTNRVPDPTDCTRYYYCLTDGSATDFTEKCPDGMLFDNVSSDCMDAASATCLTCEPTCKFECPADGSTALVANSEDCRSFFVCNNGGSVPVSCDPNKPFFNGTTCTTEESQCCDRCQVYCEQEFTEIPDPANCTNFYYCARKGFPTEEDLHHCADRAVFNQETHHCDSEAECVQPCASLSSLPPLVSTTTVGSDCVTNFVCQTTGYFPMCTHICDPHYYFCSAGDIGHTVQPLQCPTGTVIDPTIMRCVNPGNCPFRARP
ncbi:uncharacterized protein LOC134772417 [Penaeus indicus]|uniref:uncharacterized protein LOC134772417 n=1 Tax=Penaeus indicus TaxID=29960 RepID=UPI00300C5AB4